MTNGCQKGKAGEREFRDVLRSRGWEARRGRQYSGSPDSPDIVSNLPFHFEVKRVERLNIDDAVSQAVRDCGSGKTPVVAHRRNRGEWLVTLRAEDFLSLIAGTDPTKSASSAASSRIATTPASPSDRPIS